MIYALIPLLLLLAVWVGAVYRRLRELDDNIKIAMEQIGLQLSSRFRALEALLELWSLFKGLLRPSWRCRRPPSMRFPHRHRCWNRSSGLRRP